MIQTFCDQSICDFIFLLFDLELFTVFLMQATSQASSSWLFFFVYPSERRGMNERVREWVRSRWGKRLCRQRNPSLSPAGFLLQNPKDTLCSGWPSLKQSSQPCCSVGSTFYWRKSMSGALSGAVKGRDWGQAFFDHHRNWRDTNLNSWEGGSIVSTEAVK